MIEYQIVNKFSKAFYSIENFLSSVTMAILLIIVFLVTILRYIFSTSVPGLEEITVTIAVYCYFLGAACSSRNETHIRVNIIDELIEHSKLRSVFIFFRSILTIAINIIFFYISIGYGKFVLDKNLILAPLRVSKIVTVASMIMGFFLISIHEIFKLVVFYKNNK